MIYAVYVIMAILSFLIVMNIVDAIDSYKNETKRDGLACLLWAGTWIILFYIAYLIGKP